MVTDKRLGKVLDKGLAQSRGAMAPSNTSARSRVLRAVVAGLAVVCFGTQQAACAASIQGLVSAACPNRKRCYTL